MISRIVTENELLVRESELFGSDSQLLYIIREIHHWVFIALHALIKRVRETLVHLQNLSAVFLVQSDQKAFWALLTSTFWVIDQALFYNQFHFFTNSSFQVMVLSTDHAEPTLPIKSTVLNFLLLIDQQALLAIDWEIVLLLAQQTLSLQIVQITVLHGSLLALPFFEKEGILRVANFTNVLDGTFQTTIAALKR